MRPGDLIRIRPDARFVRPSARGRIGLLLVLKQETWDSWDPEETLWDVLVDDVRLVNVVSSDMEPADEKG